MKRLLILTASMVLLTACADDQKTVSENERLDEIANQLEETNQALTGMHDLIGIENDITNDEVVGLLEQNALEEGDAITDLEINGEEITLTISVGDDEMFEDKTITAESLFSRVGEELLQYDGWEVLTVEFTDIGTISLDRYQSEVNEYGMEYFPLDVIIGQLD